MTSNTLQAAVAAADITPPVGPTLQGHWNKNPSRSVLRPLEMRTLVARNERTTACILTLDAIGVDGPTTAALRDKISEAAGIPKENILIAASHTHCGPATLGVLGMSPDPAFMNLIARHAADTARRAVEALRPARFGLGCGSAHFSINRRPLGDASSMTPNYGGVVDRRARVLRIDTAEGQPLAVLFHFACHPTSKAGREGIISPDYPGFARAEIEQTLGCPAMFLPGCFGNIRPNLLNEDGSFASATEDQLRALGHDLARGVCQAARSIRTEPDARLDISQATLVLPWGSMPTEAELKAIADDPDAHEIRKAWAQKWLRKRQERQIPADCREGMQGMRLGPLQMITIPGEPVLEIGMAIERRLIDRTDAQHIWPVGYANGIVGYLCTQRHHQEGGYEPTAYPYFDCPAPFDDEERHIVETSEKLMPEKSH